jgi:tRNA(Ile)-lysidine synthase
MALLAMAHHAAPDHCHAVTVDHGLRPESAREAAMVAAFCAARAIPHAILHWKGPAPTGNLMDQARQARARLIDGWARGQGIGHILLAHTADDVAETFLMNLARQSGIDGLSGLRARWNADRLTWHRPLLHARRADLRAWLTRHQIAWIEDPTNDDPARTRTRARRALAALTPLGIDAAGLVRVSDNLRAARSVVSDAVARACAAHVVEVAGAVLLDMAALHDNPPQVIRRILIATLDAVGATDHPPREVQLANLTAAVMAVRSATLNGVRFRPHDGRIVASREPRACGAAVATARVWDNRWHVTGPAGQVRAVGAALKQVPDWRRLGLPRQVLEVTPGVWQGDRLVAAPVAGWPQGWTAELVRPLSAIILAH